MSDSSPDIAGLTAEVTQILFLTRVLISGTALVLYDYVLTFSTEISEIWNSKFSGAQALFILSRYPNMVFMVLYSAHTLTRNPSTTVLSSNVLQCDGLGRNGPKRIIWHFNVANICDISEKSIYLRHLGVALFSQRVRSSLRLSCRKIGNWQQWPCSCMWHRSVVDSLATVRLLRLAGIILSLIIDVLVFTLTFAKTIRHTIEMKRVGLGNGLGYFILRDGAMYFLLVKFLRLQASWWS
ncbi:hypothetical protein BD410DRAFT_795721 [Rickenella mellea]|uniref:DUF6533 domain-containing protein n=1 Tax=Rickenella mellea TaxID=50990 RepID=A0A4Y7PNB6_9AGAM|nr:hypothetical protein BD410DRAFT_795721 [Rickenella mellea]